MTSPIHARESRWGDRCYRIPSTGEEFPSVTSILGGIDGGPILERWIAKVCVENTIGQLPILPALLEADRDGTIRSLKLAAERERDAAADRGTRIHKAAENLILGTGIKPVLHPGDLPYWYSFLRWWREHPGIKWLSSETTIVNRTFGYAGTLDAAIRFGGVTGVLDIKTGRSVRPTWALQLAAYARGESILLPDGRELPFTPLRAAWVLHVRPEEEGGTLIVPVPVDDGAFQAFLAAMDVYRFKQQITDVVDALTKQRSSAGKQARAAAKKQLRHLHSVDVA